MLFKSKYILGTNCPKSLWLFVHKRDQQVISEATRAIFQRGTSVGELAQQYFPSTKGKFVLRCICYSNLTKVKYKIFIFVPYLNVIDND